jgi:hypothetical protein
MQPRINRRRDGRLYTNYECLLAGYRQKARGVVRDISHHGALVVETEAIPVRGELVGLTFDHDNEAVLLIGWVTRHVDHGFAIEFDHLNERAQALIDHLSALVEVERRKSQLEKLDPKKKRA